MEDAAQAPGATGSTDEPPGGRAIVLFSDGTGNSSGKLFKTNVWRMYEAVDLGPVGDGKRKQIAFYDNGVGTSGFRPLAMLGGVFGFGLRRNILEIYQYVCRNYRPANGQVPGDAIYGFGFSRGAFTMRLVIALIASQGLVAARDEGELQRFSRDAYRAFRADFLPRKLQWPTKAWRRLRARAILRWRKWRKYRQYSPATNLRPDIRFVGVWDTVAAYGGPLVEITRAIGNWFYALSMPDYRLDPAVKCARHALAIDDARDAFHPLLWDEVHEKVLIDRGKVAPDRLQQVWFTGMHADVGGGYPDESLSFVSLLWMLNEAKDAGLRCSPAITLRFRRLANSAGPVHDSRGGIGAYYRYQPRNIEAWLNEPGNDAIIADPDLPGAREGQTGLLTRVRVHESVAARIWDGTDDYAPINLPPAFCLVPEQDGEMPASEPMIPPGVRRRMEDAGSIGTDRVEALQPAWDGVWLRRVAYFGTLVVTLLLVALAAGLLHLPDPWVLGDGRSLLSGLIRLLAVITPETFDSWIDRLADNSFWFLALLGTIWGLRRWSHSLGRRMQDQARRTWRATMFADKPFPEADGSWVRRLRLSPGYRRLLRFAKWRIFPRVAAIGLVMLVAYVAAAAIVQLRLPWLESAACPAAPRQRADMVSIELSATALCAGTGLRVERDAKYEVTVLVLQGWRDGRTVTTPKGLSAGELGPAGYLGVPARRVIGANYLQPILAIRSTAPFPFLPDRTHLSALDLREGWRVPRLWRGSFVAARDGDLALFVNEAVLPVGPADWFYTHGDYRNAGAARVTIRRVADPPT